MQTLLIQTVKRVWIQTLLREFEFKLSEESRCFSSPYLFTVLRDASRAAGRRWEEEDGGFPSRATGHVT